MTVQTPSNRNPALKRVKEQFLEFAKKHESVNLTANAYRNPTTYRLKLSAESFAPTLNGEPIPIEEHEIIIALPYSFPMSPPAIYWQTAIFHPNVHPESGCVCVEIIGKKYFPPLKMETIGEILIGIASFNFYDSEAICNPKAAVWVSSLEGENRIIERGGSAMQGVNLPRK